MSERSRLKQRDKNGGKEYVPEREFTPTLSISRHQDFKSLIERFKTLPCGLDRLCDHISSSTDLVYSDDRFYLFRADICDPSEGEFTSGLVGDLDKEHSVDDLIKTVAENYLVEHNRPRNMGCLMKAYYAHWILFLHESVKMKPSELFLDLGMPVEGQQIK
jgi:hypothetical protein